MFQESLDVFLQDFGVPCQASGQTFTGVFDMPSDVIGLGHTDVVSTSYSLLAKTSDVAQVAAGTAVTVNGQVFVVREKLQEDDGAFSRLTLRK